MSTKGIEKLLAWFVPLALLAFLAGTASFALRDGPAMVFLASSLDLPSVQLAAYFKVAQSLIFALSNLAVAVWLWFETSAITTRRWLWALFGLVAGLWAAALWLLTRLLLQSDPRDS